MAKVYAEESATKEGQQPTGPEWRSKVLSKDPSEVPDYPEMPYEEGGSAIVTGGRSKKILQIHKKLGHGKYLMKDGDRVLSKIYDEQDLSPATTLLANSKVAEQPEHNTIAAKSDSSTAITASDSKATGKPEQNTIAAKSDNPTTTTAT